MLDSGIAMWQICCITSCRIVVSFSVGGVVQHVRSQCLCSGLWHLCGAVCCLVGFQGTFFYGAFAGATPSGERKSTTPFRRKQQLLPKRQEQRLFSDDFYSLTGRFFASTFSSKFAIKWSLKILLHFKHVATLHCVSMKRAHFVFADNLAKL